MEGGLDKKAVGSDSSVHYTYESDTPTHNPVDAITADGQGKLWIGTWGGGINLISPQSPQHRMEAIIAQNKDDCPINFVGALAYDSVNNGMWVGADRELLFYDLAHKQLCLPFAKRAVGDIRGCIDSIIDEDGRLWMRCLDGVYTISLYSRPVSSPEEISRYHRLKYKLDDPSSGLIEKICCFYETQDGILWLGSNDYDTYGHMQNEDGEEQFVCYNSLHGLPDNSIRSILEDGRECIWITTSNGLSHSQPTENHFINYSRQDGLADTQFYWNVTHRSRYNKFYLGTMSGLVAIDCNLPALTTQSSKVQFTRLKVGNEEIFPGSEYLPLDIAISKAIHIHEHEKPFSLEFSALDYEPDNTATCSYRLLGFDNRWIHVPINWRFATYANLSLENYTLQVEYTPYTPTREDDIAELEITIQPYFYGTTWSMLLVVTLATFATWQFYQWRIQSLKEQKARLHQKVEQCTHELRKQKQLLEEQTEELFRQNRMSKQQNKKITRQKAQLTKITRKIRELTLGKIAFFANITHEFRTPITLIIGLIEYALKLSYSPQVIEQLHLVERNSKYLLSLVSQLMDFRKVESGKLEIVKPRNSFLRFASELIVPFEVFAKERSITVRRYFRVPSPRISYDEKAMHKVLTSLLSNAIKFTPNGGSVSLLIALLSPAGNRESMLCTCVSDTGGGISDDDATKIFNRFYQSQGQARYPVYGQAGSGIGLYLYKRIVQIHGGEIHAQNNHTTGCSLRILLPITPENNTVETLAEGAPQLMAPDALPTSDTFGKGLPILVVENNADMRGYIRSILWDKYNVFEATHGAKTLSVLNSHLVDFIISDLIMPVMDGIKLPRRVREDFAISHIPFLMLTVKTSQEPHLGSYRIGVDGYLLKLFGEASLLTRTENILEDRKHYQKRFAIAMDVDALNMEKKSSGEKFLNHIMDVIKENYKSSCFGVSDFCKAAGVSKSLLNKKLQSLIGQSAGQFIRNYRLNIAHELLLKNQENESMNIAEAAYEIGSNDPKYFARCLTKYFNTTPNSLFNKGE